MTHLDRAVADINAKIKALQTARGTLIWLQMKDAVPASEPEAALFPGAQSRHGGARAAANAMGQQSWPEAIDDVLSAASKSMTVRDIVDELKRRGREFPTNSRDDTPVRSALSRRGNDLGWKRRGKRWRKEAAKEMAL